MKICFISHSPTRGGAELSMVDLIDTLSERGIESVCVLPARGPLIELLSKRGVESIVVPYKQWVHAGKSLYGRVRRMLPIRHLPAALRLAAVIKNSGCDVVYTNTVAVGAGAMGAKLAGKPHIWHIREFGFQDHGLSYDLGHRVSQSLIGRLSDICIANSQAVADQYRKSIAPTNVEVIYNSVQMPESASDLPTRGPWKHSGAIRCVLLGKLLSGKGQIDAVKAMGVLRQQGIPAELMLVGGSVDPEYAEKIERTIADLNLRDVVHRTGHFNNPMSLVSTADVVLVCSRCEAFGRVTVEGMKLGKPVIATRSGGTPEIIDHGKTGFLYSPFDVEDLAANISLLHADRELCREMGDRAKRSATKRFNQQTYGDKVEKLLNRIVRPHSYDHQSLTHTTGSQPDRRAA